MVLKELHKHPTSTVGVVRTLDVDLGFRSIEHVDGELQLTVRRCSFTVERQIHAHRLVSQE